MSRSHAAEAERVAARIGGVTRRDGGRRILVVEDVSAFDLVLVRNGLGAAEKASRK